MKTEEGRTELLVRKAEIEEYRKVMDFYHSMTDRIKERGFTITWVKDVHPSPAFVKPSIEEGTLYAGWLDERIAAAMVLNRRHVPEYRNIRWAPDPDADDCLVIHALGVDPDLTGKGVGSCMIREAVRTARKKGVSALRLDVPDTNEPSRNLYIGAASSAGERKGASTTISDGGSFRCTSCSSESSPAIKGRDRRHKSKKSRPCGSRKE